MVMDSSKLFERLNYWIHRAIEAKHLGYGYFEVTPEEYKEIKDLGDQYNMMFPQANLQDVAVRYMPAVGFPVLVKYPEKEEGAGNQSREPSS